MSFLSAIPKARTGAFLTAIPPERSPQPRRGTTFLGTACRRRGGLLALRWRWERLVGETPPSPLGPYCLPEPDSRLCTRSCL